jgi:hypothetical protein
MVVRSVWRPCSQNGRPNSGVFSAICRVGVGSDVGGLLGPVLPHLTIIRFDRAVSLSARKCVINGVNLTGLPIRRLNAFK